MEVTHHESIIAHPMMETLPNQVLPQHVVQSSPKNTSIEGSLSEILGTPGTSEILGTPGTSGVRSSLATPRKVDRLSSGGKVIDRIDNISDQTYDDHLVGKKLKCNYETGWYIGKIEHFDTKLKEYLVKFDDESHDYIREDEIDGIDLILLNDDFATKKSLKEHVNSVHEEKKNKCSKCDASFKFKKLLKKHMASDHEVKKPGKCLSKKKIEVKEKKAKSLRNSRNQNKSEYAQLNSDEEVRYLGNYHVSSKGRIIKEVKPKIINWNQKNKKLIKVKSEVTENEYSPKTKVVKKKERKKTALKSQVSNQKDMRNHIPEGLVKKRGRKKTALKNQVSNQKGMIDHEVRVLKLTWLFSKRRSVPNDLTLELQPDPQELDIQRWFSVTRFEYNRA